MLSNTRAGDGQAGDLLDKELGHLEVREWAVAQIRGKGRNLGPVHSFIGSFIQLQFTEYLLHGMPWF